MRWQAVVPFAVVLALIAVFAVGLGLKPGEIPSPLIGKPAPAFELPRLDAPDQLVTEAVLRQEPSLLNVWGSWCVACRVEHPLLNDLKESGAVPVYGLNWKDTRAAATEWLRRFGDPYVFSAYDKIGDTAIDYGVYGAPETFVIDTRGVVRYKHVGPLTQAVIDDEILPLIRTLRAEAQS